MRQRGYNQAMLVLASNSPRRRELLALLDIPFTVFSVAIDETPLLQEHPSAYVERLARHKAKQTAARWQGEAFILAADTTVAIQDSTGKWEILGKPQDTQEAERMLRRLRGCTHQVLTGLALLHTSTVQQWSDVCISEVPIRNFSDAEMYAYIASGDPFDKAGAYAIQHAGFHPVENFSGCFANVMGLPLCHLVRLLERVGIKIGKDPALQCLDTLNYPCSLATRILEDQEG